MRRFVGHLPSVQLEEAVDELALTGASLRRIPFDEWHELDSMFPLRDRNYQQTGPVFLDIEVPDLDTLAAEDADRAFTEGTDIGTRRLQNVYLALLLLSGLELINPSYSVSYQLGLESDHYGGLMRRGAADRELIVFGAELHILTLRETMAVDIRYVEGALGRFTPALSDLFNSLVRTTRASLDGVNQVLHLVGGLETLLVGAGEPLTATFARRFSVLTASDNPRENYDLARKLYGVRSDLVHGRPVAPLAEGLEDFLETELRPLVCEAALRGVNWFAANRTQRELHIAIDEAFDDPQRLPALRRAWYFQR